MRENSYSYTGSTTNKKSRTGSLPPTQPLLHFPNSPALTSPLPTPQNKKKFIPMNDENFVFFKDIIKKNEDSPSFCEKHNDSYVSYCMTCKRPMCVKCLLAHTKNHELHSVKSLNEMRTLIGKNIGSLIMVIVLWNSRCLGLTWYY